MVHSKTDRPVVRAADTVPTHLYFSCNSQFGETAWIPGCTILVKQHEFLDCTIVRLLWHPSASLLKIGWQTYFYNFIYNLLDLSFRYLLLCFPLRYLHIKEKVCAGAVITHEQTNLLTILLPTDFRENIWEYHENLN